MQQQHTVSPSFSSHSEQAIPDLTPQQALLKRLSEEAFSGQTLQQFVPGQVLGQAVSGEIKHKAIPGQIPQQGIKVPLLTHSQQAAAISILSPHEGKTALTSLSSPSQQSLSTPTPFPDLNQQQTAPSLSSPPPTQSPQQAVASPLLSHLQQAATPLSLNHPQTQTVTTPFSEHPQQTVPASIPKHLSSQTRPSFPSFITSIMPSSSSARPPAMHTATSLNPALLPSRVPCNPSNSASFPPGFLYPINVPTTFPTDIPNGVTNPAAAIGPSGAGTLALLEGVRELLLEGTCADVTVIAGEMEIKAHRIILGCMSPLLKAMLCTRPPPLGPKPVTTLHFPEVSPSVVHAFITFLYTASFGSQSAEMDFHLMELLALSDRYMVPSLKALVEDRVCGLLTPSSCVLVMQRAELYNSPRLKEACLQMIARHFGNQRSQDPLMQDLPAKQETPEVISTATPGGAMNKESSAPAADLRSLVKTEIL
eukprot:TRINITY_DN2217_c0_g5_i1.p1 TRINITY_DN2217_c0_g5~~TRINITY_DN2217_c0_g5_i1.p1  ORF type:complete len:480 (+),score=68.48 TRINITY_DN2217_c0_g5_i1:364-1803(+)